jgi:hypothetical protein
MSLLSGILGLLPLPLDLSVGDFSVANRAQVTGTGNDTIIGGNNVTVTLSGGANDIFLRNNASIHIAGGGNTIRVGSSSAVTINDARTLTVGFDGSVTFGDSITMKNNDTVTLDYSLSLAANDTVSIAFDPTIVQHNGDHITDDFLVAAGNQDLVIFTSANQMINLNLGSGDTIGTTGQGDTITIGGSASTKSSATVGATATGTTINGGLGTDTFTAGANYTGGNHYVASAQDATNGFNGIGSCANYANLATDRVTANLETGIGSGYDANGNLLWTDTYTNIEQLKAAGLNGNVLTGSDTLFSELKGSNGATTFYGGAAGDRIVWSAAGATGLLDGNGLDIAYGGTGADEFYWRNQPGGKGASNFGQTIYGFDAANGDDLNLSEYATKGFAGVTHSFAGAADLPNWVSVALAANGTDTVVDFDMTGSGNFTQEAVTLKGVDLFAEYGVTNDAAGAAQVLQDMYSSGALVLTHTH